MTTTAVHRRGFRRPRPRTLATGLKGGVGKSTIVANVAASMGRRGLRVLVVDIDPQGSITHLITGERVRHLRRSTATVVTGYAAAAPQHRRNAARRLVQETVIRLDDGSPWGTVDVLPGHPDIGWLQITADGLLDLSEVLDAVEDLYDAILIDAGPSINPLTLSGFYAADQVVAVTTPSALSEEGLDQLFALMGAEGLRRAHPGLQLVGVIANKVRRHLREREARVTELQEQLQKLLVEPHISEHAVVEDAEGSHFPVAAMPGPIAKMLGDHFDKLANKLIVRRYKQ